MISWGVNNKSGTATVFCGFCNATFSTVPLSHVGEEAQKVKENHHCIPSKPWRPTVSQDAIYLIKQSYSFQVGFQDCRGGEHFDSRKCDEWKRGWRWANERRTR